MVNIPSAVPQSHVVFLVPAALAPVDGGSSRAENSVSIGMLNTDFKRR